MAAYAIFVREETLDQAELDIYAGSIGATFEKYAPKILAAYGRQEVVEGPEMVGVVLVEFQDFETASSWYHSPEYEAVMQHRLKGGRYRGFLVDGYTP